MQQGTQQLTSIPTPPVENRPIQGDPAARRVGIFLFTALAIVTIGAGIGIGVGNIAHYRYFPPSNQSAASILFPNNDTVVSVGRRAIDSKIREVWLSMNEPLE